MDIKKSLASFYDMEAEKYYHTRNKHRADAEVFLDEIKNHGKKTIKILEFGCGSGRFLAHLAQLKGIKITYVGVDISKKLLAFAKKQISGKTAPKHIHAEFVCKDIIEYIQWLKQESFDFVVWVASFQHIPTTKERFILIKNIYRILTYEGKLLMTNRSFSQRFIKKHRKVIVAWIRRYIRSFGKYQWNDLFIPRTNKTITSKRFYHIYTLPELKKLLSLSGFVIEQLTYLNKWITGVSRKVSQNSLIIGKKSIFLKTEAN